jgi:hypothetical protein
MDLDGNDIVPDGIQEQPPAKKFKANTATPKIHACFHLNGQFANSIVDTDGVCVRHSQLVTYYEGVGDAAVAAHYFKYIVPINDDLQMCTICEHHQMTKNGATSNIIHSYIKKNHPELIPYNVMSEEYKQKMSTEWDKCYERAITTCAHRESCCDSRQQTSSPVERVWKNY